MKELPAVIFKREDCEIEVFSSDREIVVQNLQYPSKISTIDKILDEKSIEECHEKKFISSIDIISEFDIKHHPDEIKIMSQPFNRVFYKSSLEIHRCYKANKLPLIKIVDSNDGGSHLLWKSSISVEM